MKSKRYYDFYKFTFERDFFRLFFLSFIGHNIVIYTLRNLLNQPKITGYTFLIDPYFTEYATCYMLLLSQLDYFILRVE